MLQIFTMNGRVCIFRFNFTGHEVLDSYYLEGKMKLLMDALNKGKTSAYCNREQHFWYLTYVDEMKLWHGIKNNFGYKQANKLT